MVNMNMFVSRGNVIRSDYLEYCHIRDSKSVPLQLEVSKEAEWFVKKRRNFIADSSAYSIDPSRKRSSFVVVEFIESDGKPINLAGSSPTWPSFRNCILQRLRLDGSHDPNGELIFASLDSDSNAFLPGIEKIGHLTSLPDFKNPFCLTPKRRRWGGEPE